MMRPINPCLLVLMCFLVASCEKVEESQMEPPRPVLSTIARQTASASLQLTGTVEPKVQTELGFRVLGRVIARNVDVGDLVKQGDVVASIDPLALELAVKSAQSDLASAQAQFANAISTERRQRALAASRAGTEATLEEAEQAKRTTQALVAKARASLDKAEEQLSYAQLHAPFDGVVTVTSIEVGQVVAAGESVVTIARPEERDAVVDVPENAAERLRVGDPFGVVLQLAPEVRAKGAVREIAPAADSATRSRRTKIGLIDPSSSFRLGSVVTVAASIAAEPQIWLPSSAILKDGDAAKVWIVDTGKQTVHLRPIALDGTLDGALMEGRAVRIVEGINPGEQVVIAGVHKLKDGQPIRIDQEVRP